MAITLSDRAVLDLEEARTYLDIADTSKDEALILAINTASSVLESYCGTALIKTPYVDRHPMSSISQDRKKIFLKKYPLVSVTSILDGQNNAVTSSDYVRHDRIGIIEHTYTWPYPLDANGAYGEWIVSYDAGWFADFASIPYDVKQAALMLVAESIHRKSGSIREVKSGTLHVTFFESGTQNAGVPDQVAQIMSRYKVGRL